MEYKFVQIYLSLMIRKRKVQNINDKVLNHFPREEHDLLLFDEVEEDTHNLYQQEYLNSIVLGVLPPHILRLKKVHH